MYISSLKQISNTTLRIIKRHFYLFLLIGIQIIAFRNWIFDASIFTFGDVGVFTIDRQYELFPNFLSVYMTDLGLGTPNIAVTSNPFLLLLGFLAHLGIDPILSNKLTLFIPISILVVVSSYSLAYKITKSKLGAFLGSLFYCYNAYFLITVTGQLYISLTYALSPLLLFLFIDLLNKNNDIKKIIFVLTMCIIGFIEFRILYLNIVILLLYFLYTIVINKLSISEIIGLTKRFVIPSIMFVFLNIFWLLPILNAGTLVNNNFFDRGLFGNSYFNITSAFTSFHPWWTGGIPAIFNRQEPPFFYFVLPIIAILGYLINKSKKILFFLLLYAIGILLTKQVGEPFGFLYLWFYQHIPGFNAFREASKFYLITCLSLSILISHFIASLESKIDIKSSIKRTIPILLCGLASILVINFSSISTSKIGTMFIPRQFPIEYTKLNKLINDDTNYSKVLWFPHTSRFGIQLNNHPAISFIVELENSFRKYRIDELEAVDRFSAPFKDPLFAHQLNLSSIKYIIIPSNLKWDDVESPWKDPINYIKTFKKLTYLKEINSQMFHKYDIHIYENDHSRPHIYSTWTYESLSKDIPFNNVNFLFNSPHKYSLHLTKLNKTIHINFTDNYHPDWKIRVGDFNWYTSLWNGNYFLPEKYHYANAAHVNSFIIDPTYIKKNVSKEDYTLNKDGSIDLKITLYFRTQTYFYLGQIVSLGSFVIIITILIYYILKRKTNEN